MEWVLLLTALSIMDTPIMKEFHAFKDKETCQHAADKLNKDMDHAFYFCEERPKK